MPPLRARLRERLATAQLRHRLVALSAGSVVVTLVILVGMGIWESGRFTDRATVRVDALVNDDLEHVTANVDRLVRAVGASVLDAQDSSMAVAHAVAERSGGLRVGEGGAEWRATDQSTGRSRTVTLPPMLVGSTPLGRNTSIKKSTPFVDEVNAMVGGSVTVFQRMNDAGDLLRVATNVTSGDKRAIGTYIPAVAEDGTPTPVVEAILAGKKYRGIAKVVDTWSVTAYDPLIDDSGRVIGAIFAGVPQAEATGVLQDALGSMSVGAHGNASVVSTGAADRGRVIASVDASSVGGQFAAGDDDAWVESTLTRAEQQREGGVHRAEHVLPGLDDAAPAPTTVRATHYDDYDWAVVVQEYQPDYVAAVTELENGRDRMITMFVVTGLLLSAAASATAWWVATLISRRVSRVHHALTALAERDLTVTVPDLGGDEIAAMGRALNQAAAGLREMLTEITAQASQVEEASRRLDAVGVDLAESSDDAAGLALHAAESAAEVHDSVAVLSVASEEMTASIREISSSAHEAAGVAHAGVVLARDVDQVVTALDESSTRIAEMVDVIAKIAEQTNLLALNATIEAARAGEAGKGFAVVATEVKELANQTARATQEVTDRVDTIRTDTRSASTAIGTIAETISQVDDYQTAIAVAVEQQTATTNDMARSVTAAAEGTRDISTTVGRVEERMQHTREAVDVTARAVEDLAATVERLGGLVEAFRV